MNKNPLYIFLGRNQILWLEYTANFTGKSIHDLGTLPVEESLTKTIRTFLDQRLDTPFVSLIVPQDQVRAREFCFPFTNQKKIQEILPFEVESVFPVSENELSYGFTIKPAGSESIVNLFAVSKNWLIEILTLFKEKEISVRNVSIPHDLYATFPHPEGKRNSVRFYLGLEASVILEVEDNLLVKTRVSPLSLSALELEFYSFTGLKWTSLQALAHIDWSEIDSEYLRLNFGLEGRKILRFTQFFENFAKKVDQELLAFREVTDIVINISEKNDFLCRALDSLIEKKVLFDNYQNPIFPDLPISHSILGQALFLSEKKKINLLSKDLLHFKSRKKFSLNLPALILLVLSFLAIIIGWLQQSKLQDKKLNHFNKQLKIVYQDYFNSAPPTDEDPIDSATRLVADYKKGSIIFDRFLKSKSLSEVIVAIHITMTQYFSAQIITFRYSGDKVKMRVYADNFEQVDQIEQSFSNNNVFSGVKIEKKEAMPVSGGETKVRFDLILEPGKQND